MSPTPMASLSIDVDNLWTYQMIHGNPAWQAFGTYLPTVLPRLVELAARHDVRLTAFIVGQDAERPENVEAIASLVAAGHELGNHSYRHQPWLHRYDHEELDAELARAEEAIWRCGQVRPTGFRGPGYSLSEDTLRTLDRRGYVYDCSTLPTLIGPLARAYYFRSAKLDAAQRAERAHLFGDWREGLRPLRAYRWEVDGQPSLIELPVSTMPLVRIPIHVSYLLYLRRLSRRLALGYLDAALWLAERRDIELSMLLHPLDLLGPQDAADLAFFPGMDLPLQVKLDTVHDVLEALTARRRVVPLHEHVAAIAGRGLSSVPAAKAGPRLGKSPWAERDRGAQEGAPPRADAAARPSGSERSPW